MDRSSKMNQKNLFRPKHLRTGERQEVQESGIWPVPWRRKWQIQNSYLLDQSKPLTAAGDHRLTE